MTTVPALIDEAALNQYTATAAQTDFNFTYMIFATADIEVYVDGVLKTEVTDYNVRKSSGAAIASSDLPLDGGKVVFTSGVSLDAEVTLTRNIAIARLTGYSVAGAFRADVVNAEFTKILAICQQLRRDLERSISLAPFDSEGGDLTLPTGRASKLIGFDANGDAALFAGVADQEVPVSAFMVTVLDDADASAALTTLGVSTFIKSLLDDTTAAAARTTLGVAIGTNVQAYDVDLSTLAGLASIANLTALANLTGAANKIPYFTGAGAMEIAELPSNKNAIINGDFNIWQRGVSFTSTINGAYSADRWIYVKSGAMVHDISRSTDVPTVAEAGRKFNYSLKIDCTTVDSSIAAGDFAVIEHRVEGYNWLPLAQKAGVISFWLKAPKTGVYGVALKNSINDRSFVGEITVNSANTWEKKTVNYSASPSAGTWDYTNGIGLAISLVLAAGTNYQTTKDTWQTGAFLTTSNQVNACDNTSNDLYLTGVQLEVGSIATPFEVKSFSASLAECLRYYQKSYDYATAIAALTQLGEVGLLRVESADYEYSTLLQAQMRSAPTVATYSPITGASGKMRNFSTDTDHTPTVSFSSEKSFKVNHGGLSAGNLLGFHYTVDAEL